MLEFYSRLAARLQPHAWVGWILVAAAATAFPAAVFLVQGETGQFLGLAAIALLLWALTLSAFIRAFAGPLPTPAPGTGLITRLRAQLSRLYRWLLAVLFTLLLVLVTWFSLRAILLMTDDPAAEVRVGSATTGRYQQSKIILIFI